MKQRINATGAARSRNHAAFCAERLRGDLDVDSYLEARKLADSLLTVSQLCPERRRKVAETARKAAEPRPETAQLGEVRRIGPVRWSYG